ncbi:uncharacterized protein G2W53_027927 [Senna tora]|uniref:Uncharacterized protein n=1 Tax=Senna tora TaxID=362788 RepID=A0A834T2H0_9FABA|nr:uncharacterized protein G2W53_027927 [Senna tora]
MKRTRQSLLPTCRMWMSSGQCKLMTTKPPSRAAVHGVKAPLPDIIDKEVVEREIQKAKEEKEAKRKQIEKTLESHINSSNSKSDHHSSAD